MVTLPNTGIAAELNPDYALNAYNYDLPPTQIAQNPAVPRDHSRLLHISPDRQLQHHQFYDLPQFLRAGDLLLLNNTKVIPARMFGTKQSGVAVEILLMEPMGANRWLSLVKPGKRLPIGSTIVFNENVTATVEGIDPATRARELQFHLPDHTDLLSVIDQLGQVPFPPYVTASDVLSEQYQTIYAKVPGAIAAPTAGLHFTDQLFAQLEAMGVQRDFITLHVGLGTFRPVETENITEHIMHSEWLSVSAEVIEKIRTTKANGGRVIAVGSTVVRAIESAKMQPFEGKTNLMIYPGYQWQVLDGIITNFHLPKSTLLMMMAAFLGENGREFLLSTYDVAINGGYRFYSFGDAMLMWRGN
ncbi:MAG: tRNA preQ1(34) S-adenosylmethionine ribosyltransferase-isomerase QueA [Pseudanabaena sp. ELA607]|jgi:S-adenosylmethionine:tRNA ribosyltransferase-isomerase